MTNDAELKVDPSLVMAGIEAEIQRVSRASASDGWNNWAVVGGIGTLLWVLTSELSPARFTRELLGVTIFFAVLLDAGFHVGSVTPLSQIPRLVRPGRRLSLAEFATHRLNESLRMLRAVAIIIMCAAYERWSATTVLALIYYSAMALSSALLVGVSFSNRSIPSDLWQPRLSKSMVHAVFWWLFFLAVFAKILFDYGEVSFAAWSAGHLGEADVRVAGILVALVFLLSKTSWITSHLLCWRFKRYDEISPLGKSMPQPLRNVPILPFGALSHRPALFVTSRRIRAGPMKVRKWLGLRGRGRQGSGLRGKRGKKAPPQAHRGKFVPSIVAAGCEVTESGAAGNRAPHSSVDQRR